MRRRVKITGIGPVTPAGIGREAFFHGINESVSRVRALTRFGLDTGLSLVGAEIHNFDPAHFAPRLNSKRVSRYTQFGVAGTVLALEDAGLTPAEISGLAPVIITGTCSTDFEKIGRALQAVGERGPRHAHATMVYDSPSFTVSGKIAEYLEVPTRMYSLQTACCSGLDAIGQAAEMVASGQSDLAITGGTEAPLTQCPLFELTAAELSPLSEGQPEKCCRPFDLWRSTGVIGEGAAIVILEPETSPRKPYAWISGYGFSNDCDAGAGLGIADAMEIALANASRRAAEVDFINAWGPGHRSIDFNEVIALKRIFGSRLAEIPCVSIKGAIGTAFGAAGAIQTASTALTLFQGVIPPTVNWETADPNCPLNLSARPRRLQPSVAVINAHGLTGGNAVLVLERVC